MSDQPARRVQGVALGGFGDVLEEVEYPITSADLVERHGDRQLEYANGRERVGDVLGPVDDTFASAAEARRAVVGLVGMGAVGRTRYTDRGGTTPAELQGSPIDSV